MVVGAQPFEGITIVDLSQIYNGPYATYLMALGGARVIKVEPPGGEPLRRRGVVGGAALPFAMLNSNKESIVLDLKSDDGRQVLLRLVRRADVIVENFAPGAMDRLGLSEEVLKSINPNLIYASSSGFGRDGPYRDYPAMDLTVQAFSGIMHTTGFADRPPVKTGPAIADFMAGIHLYGAIATALFKRVRTGEASRVEVSMQDAVFASLASSLGLHWASQDGSDVPARTGNRHGGLAEAPYNVYPTSDGYISIICVRDEHWRSLCNAMGREDLQNDARFETLSGRVAAIDEIDEIVGYWASLSNTGKLFDTLTSHRVPAAPVRDLNEVLHDPNMIARRSLAWVEHPKLGSIPVQGSPIRFAELDPVEFKPSGDLGDDTNKILLEFCSDLTTN